METFASIDALKRARRDVLGSGPIGIILAEDDCEIAFTLSHMVRTGFRRLILAASPDLVIDEALPSDVIRVGWRPEHGEGFEDIVNALIEMGPGLWMHYAFNAEYLFYPFSEHRSVGEMLAFHAEERRAAMLTYVIDLYAGDLSTSPDGVSLGDAYLDRSAYYALTRKRAGDPITGAERQYDFYGSLRWRFEEHVPMHRRRIDRIGLFQARRGLRMRPDHTFNVEEYNTYACPWHNNLTAAICSFRAAKALKRNAGSRYEIGTFRWHNSERFTWSSQQLLKLGLIEPGQWF